MHIAADDNRAMPETLTAGQQTLPDELPWYALSTRSRQEKLASMTLESMGITHFLPVIDEEHRWSDRKKVVTVPLFPGYMFVQVALTSEIHLIRKVRGIVDFVGNHRGPLAIPLKEIENVRALVSRGANCSPHPLLAVGQRVRVVRGALAGVEGTLIRYGGRSRIVVSVEIIQRAVSVDVAVSDAEPIAGAQVPQEPHFGFAQA